jgi:prepilin-type N-terminal cleavage/methylation domain-containing protein
MTSKKQRGFSLLEMMITIAIGLTLAGITSMALMPVLKQQHVDTAYNETLNTLRHARDRAAGDMRTYVVTFSNTAVPNTITVQQSINAAGACQIPPTGPVLMTTVLPSDITFQVEPGVPTSNGTAPTTPDAFGTAAFALDLDALNNPGTNTLCLNPDGTASDVLGNISNGVVYMGRTGDVYSARAISVWGSTGRIRGWRLYSISGTNTWRQQ